MKNFSRAQFSKLRNGINGVGEFRYVAKISYQSDNGLEIDRGDQNCTQTHTHTDTHTHTHTYRHTHTHTHTPAAHYIRLKIEF